MLTENPVQVSGFVVQMVSRLCNVIFPVQAPIKMYPKILNRFRLGWRVLIKVQLWDIPIPERKRHMFGFALIYP